MRRRRGPSTERRSVLGRSQSCPRPRASRAPAGPRISHEALNRHSGTVIALAITSQPQRAGFPLTHPVESVRLPKASWIKISQIRTLSIERLGRRIGAASADEVDRIVEGLFELVG